MNRPSGDQSLGRLSSFSPSGNLIAYRSDRTGRPEIYVQTVPSGAPVPVSVDGGFEPFWQHDGKVLYFVSPDNWLMAVDVELDANTAAGIRTEQPTRLFELPEHGGLERCIDVDLTPAGHFLVVTADAAADAPMNVLFNWTSVLKRPGRSGALSSIGLQRDCVGSEPLLANGPDASTG